ncbi:hypothetical protein ABC795_11985 [Blastococcus sp. HT6-30]
METTTVALGPTTAEPAPVVAGAPVFDRLLGRTGREPGWTAAARSGAAR